MDGLLVPEPLLSSFSTPLGRAELGGWELAFPSDCGGICFPRGVTYGASVIPRGLQSRRLVLISAWVFLSTDAALRLDLPSHGS